MDPDHKTLPDQAVERFSEGLNCAQAILLTYGPASELDEPAALKLGSALGGGMGNTGRTCGAVSGAALILGLRYGPAQAQDKDRKQVATGKVREFVSHFEERNGAVQCRDLLGCNIATPEGMESAQQEKLFTTRCPGFVRAAAEILDEMV